MSDYRARACTCHPDKAPRPCLQRYAYSECVLAAKVRELEAEIERLQTDLTFASVHAHDYAEENVRLRTALETIRHGTVSGHIEYTPVRDFIDRVLDGEKQ